MHLLINLLALTARGWEHCARDVDPVSTGAVYGSTVICQAPRLWKEDTLRPVCQGANYLERLLGCSAGSPSSLGTGTGHVKAVGQELTPGHMQM